MATELDKMRVARKRKKVSDEVNWDDDEEMEQMMEKKRRLEAAEPYNSPAARHRAKEAGIAEARRSSLSDVSKACVDAEQFL